MLPTSLPRRPRLWSLRPRLEVRYGDSCVWTVREAEELREPLELRLRVDFARIKLESCEWRGLEGG
jgi:hypothetical protein